MIILIARSFVDGKIYVKANPNLDYELGTKQFVMTVSVSDGHFTETVALTIDVVEVPEPPTFTNLPAAISVTEDATLATGVIFTVMATDEDAGDVVTLTSSISPTANHPFTFTTSSGKHISTIELHIVINYLNHVCFTGQAYVFKNLELLVEVNILFYH